MSQSVPFHHYLYLYILISTLALVIPAAYHSSKGNPNSVHFSSSALGFNLTFNQPAAGLFRERFINHLTGHGDPPPDRLHRVPNLPGSLNFLYTADALKLCADCMAAQNPQLPLHSA